MDKKKNGHANGHDQNIVSFPSAKERDAQRKAEEKAIRAEYKARKKAGKEPFFNAGNIPPFSKFFIAAIVLTHLVLFALYQFDSYGGLEPYIHYTFGFMPGMFTGQFEWNILALLSPITHIFLHGGWFHLFLNAAMGLALSMFFERIYGTRTTIIFCALCALGGIAVYMLFFPFTTIPVIGASGVISGLFGAMLLNTLQQIQYQDQIYSTRAIVGGQHALRQKASQIMKKKGPWPILFFWGALMTFFGLLMGDNVAWSVHLGGYTTGIALLVLMQKGKIKI